MIRGETHHGNDIAHVRLMSDSGNNRFNDTMSFIREEVVQQEDKRKDPFEWLSMSWRKHRSENMSNSRAEAILKMIDRNY